SAHQIGRVSPALHCLGLTSRLLRPPSRRQLSPYLIYRDRGRPRTLSARMLRKTSEVPASIVLARERKNWYFQPSPSPTCDPGPPMSIAVSVIRWFSSDHMSLRMEPSGPGMPLRLAAVTAR